MSRCRSYSAIFLIAMLLSCFAGCSKQAAKGPKGTAKNPWVIGMSQCNLAEPYRVQMNADIKAAAAKHPEITVLYKDAQANKTVQQDQVREFIAQGVDLIIISPLEALPLTKPVGEAMDAGIPVVVLDRKIEGDKYTCYIGADNVKIGYEAGKHIVELLGGKGSVVELMGRQGSTPCEERHEGFMQAIKGSEIEVIFDPYCNWMEPLAQDEMKSALSRFPQIDAVYAHNDPAAHGAYLAAKQEGKGREKTIKFVGIDALSNEGVRYVKEDILSATFKYPTGGEIAVDNALKILKGEKVEKNIKLGTKIFTKENVDKGGVDL